MKGLTQREWVEKELREKGEIDNVYCVQNFVLRLGAIICQLRKDGWAIDGAFIPGTKNYRYKLSSAPALPKKLALQEITYLDEQGVPRSRWEYAH
jgi:hypothetical protein